MWFKGVICIICDYVGPTTTEIKGLGKLDPTAINKWVGHQIQITQTIGCDCSCGAGTIIEINGSQYAFSLPTSIAICPNLITVQYQFNPEIGYKMYCYPNKCLISTCTPSAYIEWIRSRSIHPRLQEKYEINFRCATKKLVATQAFEELREAFSPNESMATTYRDYSINIPNKINPIPKHNRVLYDILYNSRQTGALFTIVYTVHKLRKILLPKIDHNKELKPLLGKYQINRNSMQFLSKAGPLSFPPF